jgi:hypothetical protein
MNSGDTSNLCLECGLCCNGVIFARGQLQPTDDAVRLKVLGLRLVTTRNSKSKAQKFHQPCAALDGCRCRIYVERPDYCRQFECGLLKKVLAGRSESGTALRTIRKALRCVENVKRLLQLLGNTDDQTALSLRFQATRKRMERAELDKGTAATFGELTLAVHELNTLLSEQFYPGI